MLRRNPEYNPDDYHTIHEENELSVALKLGPLVRTAKGYALENSYDQPSITFDGPERIYDFKFVQARAWMECEILLPDCRQEWWSQFIAELVRELFREEKYGLEMDRG